MNYSLVNKMYIDSESSVKKVRIPKKEFKKCEQKSDYKKYKTTYIKIERRKQTKTSYDTWRRADMPTEQDYILEDMHYANFLGDKNGNNGAYYNNGWTVNLSYCDGMIESYNNETQHIKNANSSDSLSKTTDSRDCGDYNDNISELSFNSFADDYEESIVQ